MSEHDPVIVALLKKLPEAGTFWPVELRQRWLDAMEATLDLVYEGRAELRSGPIQLTVTGVNHPCPEKTVQTFYEFVNTVDNHGQEPDSELPNAMREVLTDTHVLAVATHVPEERLQVSTATHEELDAKATKPVTHDDSHQPILPRKNVGGAPSQVGRPENIPTNREMAVEAIKALGPASATQIRDYVKKHHWPNVPAHWTATLYEMVTSNKLKRQGINFVLPPESKAVVAAPKLKPKSAAVPPALPRLYGPREQQEEFQHNGRGTMLSPKEYLLASRLRNAIGKGHIGVQYLAENALGLRRGQGEEAKLTLRGLATAMQERLATVGLTIEYHEGFGFLMKEVEVG